MTPKQRQVYGVLREAGGLSGPELSARVPGGAVAARRMAARGILVAGTRAKAVVLSAAHRPDATGDLTPTPHQEAALSPSLALFVRRNDVRNLSTTYQFTARYAADGSELHGHCEHKLVNGTGDFAGITGQVNFKDDVQTGEFLYEGHLQLP